MFLLGCPLALLVLAQDRSEPRVPWVVVGQILPVSHDAVYEPHLLVRADGSLVATVTHVGHGGIVLGTHVYRSNDHGSSWSRPTTVLTPCDAALFEVGGKLYLLGTHSFGGRGTGRAEICRSVDGGETWPDKALLGSGEQWKASEFEILRDHGRFWRLYRRSENDLSMHVSVASVPVDADPMKTESWTWSEEVSRNDDYGLWGCLLSPGSEGGPMLLGRRNWRTVEFVAELTNDGRAVKTRKGGELPDLGGRSIRSLERGPATGETFVPSLTNSRGFYGRPSEVRLESSSDLTHWTDRSILLRDDRKDAVEFSSCTRTYAGEDLLMILCARIPGMPATDAEEQLWWEVLFLRVPKFRERKPETPPLWDGSR